MSASSSLFFDIFGRDHGVGQMLDGVGDRATGMGGKFKAVGVAMGAGLLALGGAILKTGFDELKDASANTAQLEAGIKSTGGAANTTADGMNALASAIQDYSGQTDDSITNAESLLLTFTNIKNVGADKIFDDATKAAADMAAKLGGDAATQAMTLGKALNDPAEGLTRLTRVGVTFTDAQKDQIKALQESGDTMGAQKVILAELQTEFGGAAKAAGDSLPGQLARSKRAFEDLSQGLVTALLPALTGAASLMTGVAKWASQNQGVVMALAVVVGVLAVAFIVLSAAAAIAASPFIWIGLAIAALIAGLVLAYNNVGWFKDGVNAFITGVGAVVGWLYGSVIQPTFAGIVAVISGVVGFIAGTVVPGFANAFNWIGNAITNTIQFFVNFRSGVVSAIAGAIDFVQSIPGRILGVLSGLGGLLFGIGKGIIDGFFNGLKAAWGAVTDFVGGIAGWIADHKGPISVDEVLLVPAGKSIMGGFGKTLRAAFPEILKDLDNFTNDIGGVGGSSRGMQVSRQLVGAGMNATGTGGSSQLPPIYVQNPFTGEYLLTKVDDRVDNGIGGANDYLGRRPSR